MKASKINVPAVQEGCAEVLAALVAETEPQVVTVALAEPEAVALDVILGGAIGEYFSLLVSVAEPEVVPVKKEGLAVPVDISAGSR